MDGQGLMKPRKSQVVLPLCTPVPCSIQGTYLCKHVNKYHHQNPNQLSTAQLLRKVAMVSALTQEAIGQKSMKSVCFNLQIRKLGIYTYKKQVVANISKLW
jgi:hypothetical protein